MSDFTGTNPAFLISFPKKDFALLSTAGEARLNFFSATLL